MAPTTRSQKNGTPAKDDGSKAPLVSNKKHKHRNSAGGGTGSSSRDEAAMADISVVGTCLFILQLSAVAYVLSEGWSKNQGKKFVRVHHDDCHKAWVEIMAGREGQIACCKSSMDPEAWDAAICQASMSATTEFLTTLAALVLPLVPFFINWAFSCICGMPFSVHVFHRRRLALYVAIIAFRTLVLLKGFNLLQDLLQESEGDACWYAPRRKDGSCRERFDFADHLVLFVGQYLSIQTFEAIAILSEAKNRVHKALGIMSVIGLCAPCLVGLHHTISFFHSRGETLAAFGISLVFVQLPLLLIISNRKWAPTKWLQLSHYISH